MSYILAASHSAVSVLTTNGLTIVICSSVAGIVAMLFAGRKS